jgi:hypothetical protein
MSFSEKNCAIPTVWCGKGAMPRGRREDSYYYRSGTSYECSQKGYAAGMYGERKKHLPSSSLQQIKYIGEVYEQNFRKKGVSTLSQLISKCENMSSAQIRQFLEVVLTRKKSTIDQRAYNSVLLYLYRHGIGHLPPCSKISPSKE